MAKLYFLLHITLYFKSFGGFEENSALSQVKNIHTHQTNGLANIVEFFCYPKPHFFKIQEKYLNFKHFFPYTNLMMCHDAFDVIAFGYQCFSFILAVFSFQKTLTFLAHDDLHYYCLSHFDVILSYSFVFMALSNIFNAFI